MVGVGLVLASPLGAQAPIRIGTFLSVTGAGAFLGAPALATLKLYVDLVNAQGGLLGRRLSLIQYDVASIQGPRKRRSAA